jgi:hypothetical protein
MNYILISAYSKSEEGYLASMDIKHMYLSFINAYLSSEKLR